MEAKNLVCFNCVHFREFAGGCDAFPEGIHEKITSGRDEHKEPLKGQGNEIVFEPIEAPE
jgi:hypothetical protein